MSIDHLSKEKYHEKKMKNKNKHSRDYRTAVHRLNLIKFSHC